MSVRLSCPSCNTNFAIDAIPAGRRATCPRCGDVFPVRGEVGQGSGDGSQGSEGGDQEPRGEPRLAAPLPSTRGGLSVTQAAFIAAALGLVGLAAGLGVYFTRERPKPTPQPEPPAASANATPLAQLVGLGYLPAECNVVFAIQPGPIITHAERTKQEPRELLRRTGLGQPVVAALDAMGLTLPQVDHVAGGAHLGDEGQELRLAFVLVLKQPPASEEEFLKKLKAKPQARKDARWGIDLEKAPLLQALARVSPTVWVFGLGDRDFSALDRNYGPGGAQFRGSESEGVRKMIATVPPDAAVWFAADDEREWTQKPLMKSAAFLKDAKTWLPAVNGGRGALFAVAFGEKPRMRLLVHASDAAKAERARTYLQARAAEVESASAGGGGVYALFDAPFDPATTWPMLQRLLEDARK